MKALRVTEKASSIDTLNLQVVEAAERKLAPGECLIEVHGAGVNPSDVKATLGAMPHAVWPRTPGRDFAGVVVQGPAHLQGKAVWGSGGELGIRRDGTHGRHLVLDEACLREKPESMSMLEAGAIGVPFITAYEGLRRAGLPGPGDVVLVFGGNGKVGQATVQIATSRGARVFAVERKAEPYRGHASGEVTMLDASSTDIAAAVLEQTGGHGADIVYNTVGSPYFEAANKAMAVGARQIFISTIDRAVPFDIFSFYRGQHTYLGIDTLAMDSMAGARIFDELAPGFASGVLKPFPVFDHCVYDLANAVEGYRAVLAGAPDRIVLKP